MRRMDERWKGLPRGEKERLAALLAERRRRAARQSLIAYAQATLPGYRAAAHHRRIAARLEALAAGTCERLMIAMPPRHGKLCADSTPVLTPHGWVDHGSLAPGDRVCHPSGRVVSVAAVGERGAAALALTCTHGEVVKCHPRHEWHVYDRSSHRWRTVETGYLAKQRLFSGGRCRFQLPAVKAAEFEEQPLALDPYVLGAWLGDGSTAKPVINHAPDDKPIIERIARAGYEISAVWRHPTTGVMTTSFAGGLNNPGRMTRELQEIDVWSEKHIPDAYKFSSIRQRCAVLAGLVDTDGHVEQSTGRVRIATASERLARDIIDVATTLGFRPSLYVQAPALSTSGIRGRKPIHYVGFQPTMALPTAVARKRPARLAPQRRVGIRTIAPCSEEPGRCIQVDSADGLYLVGRALTPTHNSELASIRFPAWFLGRHPEKEVIAASYNLELARHFGRAVRNLAAAPEHRAVFPEARIAADSGAAERWHTAAGGSYLAAGVDSAVTGRGADLVIIDDPVKSRAEAESASARAHAWDWYRAVVYTRLMPGGAVVLIQTRWHEDDLAGRLLAEAESGGDRWEVLHLPALDEAGRALWPAWYPAPALARIRAVIGPREWQALYQGEPAPDEGSYFKRAWMRSYDTAPAHLRAYGASDYAVTDAGGDYTGHAPCGASLLI